MPFLPQQFAPVAVECPFLDQPCVQGPVQGFHCRLRAPKAGETESLVRFLNDAVIFYTVCKKEIGVSPVPRAATGRSKKARTRRADRVRSGGVIMMFNFGKGMWL